MMGKKGIWFIAVFFSLLILLFWMFWWEPSRIKIIGTEHHVPVKSRVRIALLSDLHFPSPHLSAATILKKLTEIQPDLILISGDIRNHHGGFNAGNQLLNQMGRLWTTIAVPGDADICGSHGQCLYCQYRYGNLRRQTPAYTWLKNEKVHFPGKGLTIIGSDDPVSGLDDWQQIPTGAECNILLIHSTHKLQSEDFSGFDLVLAGNTHGGQLFFLKPFLASHKQSIDNRYLQGFHRISDSTSTLLAVSPGLGTSYIPARLGVPPSILVIDLIPEEQP